MAGRTFGNIPNSLRLSMILFASLWAGCGGGRYAGLYFFVGCIALIALFLWWVIRQSGHGQRAWQKAGANAGLIPDETPRLAGQVRLTGMKGEHRWEVDIWPQTGSRPVAERIRVRITLPGDFLGEESSCVAYRKGDARSNAIVRMVVKVAKATDSDLELSRQTSALNDPEFSSGNKTLDSEVSLRSQHPQQWSQIGDPALANCLAKVLRTHDGGTRSLVLFGRKANRLGVDITGRSTPMKLPIIFELAAALARTSSTLR